MCRLLSRLCFTHCKPPSAPNEWQPYNLDCISMLLPYAAKSSGDSWEGKGDIEFLRTCACLHADTRWRQLREDALSRQKKHIQKFWNVKSFQMYGSNIHECLSIHWTIFVKCFRISKMRFLQIQAVTNCFQPQRLFYKLMCCLAHWLCVTTWARIASWSFQVAEICAPTLPYP